VLRIVLSALICPDSDSPLSGSTEPNRAELSWAASLPFTWWVSFRFITLHLFRARTRGGPFIIGVHF